MARDGVLYLKPERGTLQLIAAAEPSPEPAAAEQQHEKKLQQRGGAALLQRLNPLLRETEIPYPLSLLSRVGAAARLALSGCARALAALQQPLQQQQQQEQLQQWQKQHWQKEHQKQKEQQQKEMQKQQQQKTKMTPQGWSRRFPAKVMAAVFMLPKVCRSAVAVYTPE